ncbi:cytochrome ubiquinol oxidase subunit I, partial [uncultured Hyphomicrobium sp.]
HEVRDGIAYPVSWLEIIFNPSFPYRFSHMFTAAYLTTSLVVAAVGARYLLAGRFVEESKTMLRMGIGMVAVLAPLQLVIGDAHGLNTAKHQPVKVAAMEAHWDGSKPADLVLFAWPNEAEERNDYEISIPNIASLIITHDVNGLFKGLKDFAPQDRPPVKPVFFAFRVMVGIGMLMIAAGLIGAFLWWRGLLFNARWYLWPLSLAWPAGFIAILAGWWVTETGRQPWLVYGILRTKDAASPVSAEAVLTTLVAFVIVYSIVFSMGIYYINRLIEKGPTGASVKPSEGVPSRPLSAAEEAAHEAIDKKG